MEELKRRIHEFLVFVENPSNSNKIGLLEKHLVNIYSIGLNLSDNIEPNSESPKKVDYEELRKSVGKNFGELGYYHMVLNPNDIYSDAQFGTGDAIDDLTDIIKDLKEAMSIADDNTFLWQLNFSFKSHFKEHLIQLLNYLNELES